MNKNAAGAEVLWLACSGSQALATDICAYAGTAYSKGYEGCFQGIDLECTGANTWTQRGSCTGTGLPTGGGTLNPADISGSVCVAGGQFSPGSEMCNGSNYQVCQDTGSWIAKTPPTGAPSCP